MPDPHGPAGRPADPARRHPRVELWLAGLAFLCLTAAALITLADIALRTGLRIGEFFGADRAGLAIVGTVDLVQLAVMAAAYLAITVSFLEDGHVTVDFLYARLSHGGRRLLRILAALLSGLFMGMIFRYGLAQASLVVQYGDRSATLGIPMIWYWVPLLLGAALSTGCALWHLWREIRAPRDGTG